MGGLHLQSTLRELQQFFRSQRLWATFAIVVLIFTVTGPFGTGERFPPLARLAYWSAVHAVAWSIAIICSLLAKDLLPNLIRSLLARMMIGSLIAALPISLAVEIIDYGFSGDPIHGVEIVHGILTTAPLCVLFCLLAYLTMSSSLGDPEGQASSNPASTDYEVAPKSAPLLDRLQHKNRGALQRMSVSDHYTEVVTSRGRELVLLRFSDALKELGETPGLQCHRSHWVADEHVAGIERTDGKLTVVTKDGTRLPVSRTFAADIRARYGHLVS